MSKLVEAKRDLDLQALAPFPQSHSRMAGTHRPLCEKPITEPDGPCRAQLHQLPHGLSVAW